MKLDLSKIRELRKSKNLKQSEIAEILNVSQQTYSRYETGEILIDVGSLVELSKYYHTNIEYLIGLTDDSQPYEPLSQNNKKEKIKKQE